MWGGTALPTRKLKNALTDEVQEVLASRDFCQVPAVCERDLPPYTGALATVERTLVTVFRMQEKSARSLLCDAYGTGRPQYAEGRHIDCRVTKVSPELMRKTRYKGHGYMFDTASAHLVWFLLLCALGNDSSFVVRSSLTKTLVCFKQPADFERSAAWARSMYRADIVFWIRCLIQGDRSVFARMLAVFDTKFQLWGECPVYYRVFATLVEALDHQPPGVVLGALCPHVPRAGRPDGPPQSIVKWYLDAGDTTRPLEWRRQVVEALAIPCLANLPSKHPEIHRKQVTDAFPNYTLAVHAARLVKTFCLAKIEHFPLLVPDGHKLGENTRGLDRAVCDGEQVPLTRRLPSAQVSERLMAMLRKIN